MVLVADRRSALKKAFWRRHEKYLRIIAYSGPSGIPRIWLYGLQGARAGVSGSPARWILPRRGEGRSLGVRAGRTALLPQATKGRELQSQRAYAEFLRAGVSSATWDSQESMLGEDRSSGVLA
jgi:hypothetical protein